MSVSIIGVYMMYVLFILFIYIIYIFICFFHLNIMRIIYSTCICRGGN